VAPVDLSRSELPFGQALTLLVREVEDDSFLTPGGALKVSTFAAMLDGVPPSALAAAMTGTRAPSHALLGECARFLRVRPDYFREYRDTLPRAA